MKQLQMKTSVVVVDLKNQQFSIRFIDENGIKKMQCIESKKKLEKMERLRQDVKIEKKKRPLKEMKKLKKTE